MNYELAKQLKEAGFSQIGKGDMWLLDDPSLFEDKRNQTVSVLTRDDYIRNTSIERNKYGEDLYIPTLEELIEECGDMFLSLRQDFMFDNINSFQWYADSRCFECKCDSEECGGTNWRIGEGKTPIEAVAKLWLELN